jgi:hypothetical protein
MENTITRIADLPIGGNGMGSSQQQSPNVYSNMVPTSTASMNQANDVPTNYIPINVHPNPYGISTQNPIMPNPQQTNGSQNPPLFIPPQSQYPQEDQQHNLSQMQHQRLPSRDIPKDSIGYTHDEQIQANYIPPRNVSSDYVRDYEDMTEKNRIEYENKKRRESRFDSIITELQTPLFIAILFFFFQLPSVNTYLFKNLSFLSIYNADGNFNFNGLLLKSCVFGSLYYIVTKATNYLSEL